MSARAVPGFWERLRRQYAPAPFLTCAAARVIRRAPAPAERLHRIGELGKALAPLAIDELRSRALALRGQPLPEILETAFAVTREMSRRVHGLYHHDVQILGGLVLAEGAIAEMATGEGKTLVQLLPAAWLGFSGRGVHVATANGYLAERDEAFGRPVLNALGLTCAYLPERVAPPRKRIAYQADVTYGTGSEFGFDYLRDQLALRKLAAPQPGERMMDQILGRERTGAFKCQRELHAAILDEADSILIDEALTPLVISGRQPGGVANPGLFLEARRLTDILRAGEDYRLEAHTLQLTETGLERIHHLAEHADWDQLRRPWSRYVENALRARYLFRRNHEYLVRDGKIVLIDGFTGRVKEGSSWRDGLHQAVEAAEGVEITAENESEASISRQKFFRLYEKVCGMTGTALESAGELWEVYKLTVEPIPRHKPSLHVDEPARIFVSEEAKLAAIADEIARRHALGQPVLAGTRTITNGERLAAILSARGLPFQLLNASQDAEEAAIVAKAGEPGAITIATNMAGRGTHIDLGPGVAELGGLFVIALEMEESSRIDRQLFGRAARQGKPGGGQFFLSAEDHLLTRHAPEDAARLRAEPGPELPPATFKLFERAQTRAAQDAYHQRLATMEHDRWQDETKRRLA